METQVWKIDRSDPDEVRIRAAAEIIDTGGLVAFPTETVYGIACKVSDEALARLANLKNRPAEKHYTLHIGRKGDLDKYVPSIGLSTRKLIANAWPGPLTIVFELSDADIAKVKNSLSDEVLKNLYRNNTIGIRCPDDPIASLLLSSAKYAVVAPSANISSQPPSVTADEVKAYFDGQIELIIDGGTTKYKKNSTVVKTGKNGLTILREGVLSREQVDKMRMITFLFVCTGNTCRSPMAQALFSKYLAEKLNCRLDQISDFGYKVLSAGTMGLSGLPATAEAVEACRNKGCDIGKHRSSALTGRMIEESDFIFAMTKGHRETVIAMNPQASRKCILLEANENILDPIGQSQHVYDKCADKIENAVKNRIDEFVI